MKCPKCGFNSFEYLDSCKRCNHDLAAFKLSLGIQPCILPQNSFTCEPEETLDAHTLHVRDADNAAAPPEDPLPTVGLVPDFIDRSSSQWETGGEEDSSFLTTPADEGFSFDEDSPLGHESADLSQPWNGSSDFSAENFGEFSETADTDSMGLDQLFGKRDEKQAQTPPAPAVVDFAALLESSDREK